MEFVAAKKSKNRKRKRNTKNKRRVARKLEVKATIRRKVFSHASSAMRVEQKNHTMDAHTFWENYKVAQDWQQRHSVAWWRSRCHALEHENQILRQKIRSQASNRGPHSSLRRVENENEILPPAENVESDQDDNDDDDENLEFQVDKDMLEFLEQSIRHKMELKRVRESEMEAASDEAATSDIPFVSGEARIQAKTKDAQLLYGDASPRIMAMEAALQATVDRHKDRAKPHYWPNIPLKP